MKFFKDSWSYIYKNWLYLLIVAIPVGVFAGVLYNPFKSISLISNFNSTAVKSFGDIFSRMFDFSFKGIVVFILAFIVISITTSIALGFIENHMRSGKKNYNETLKYFNNNIIIVMLNLAIFAGIIFVIKFLLSALIFLFFVLFTGLGNTPNIGTIIISVLLISGAVVLLVQIFTVFMIIIPNMMINGFSFKNALYSSIKMVNKTNFKMLLAGIIPFALVFILVIITNGFWLVNVVLTIVLFVYYTALSMVAYFSVSDTTRYDNRKYYINY